MPNTPSSVLQVALLILFVLPGAVYQLARDRLAGPVPSERVLGERVLRAVVASIVLNGVYAATAGPWLLEFGGGDAGRGWSAGISERPRVSGTLALLIVSEWVES